MSEWPGTNLQPVKLDFKELLLVFNAHNVDCSDDVIISPTAAWSPAIVSTDYADFET